MSANYTEIDTVSVNWYYNSTRVLRCYMLGYTLFIDIDGDAKVGVGITNPTSRFQVNNLMFMKDVYTQDNLSFQLTNPGYNNEPYGFVPVGTVAMWGSSNFPENWAACDGSSIKISNYPDLYKLVGYTYTPLEIQNTNVTKLYEDQLFTIPDFRGGVVPTNRTSSTQKVGTRYPNIDYTTTNNMDTYITSRNTLIQSFTLQSKQLPGHGHFFQSSKNKQNQDVAPAAMQGHTHTITTHAGATSILLQSIPGLFGGATSTTDAGTFYHTHTFTNSALTPIVNNPFSIEQQYIVMFYIIKLK
jgi:microcystin-dependent protein